jgi:hypothetical protein
MMVYLTSHPSTTKVQVYGSPATARRGKALHVAATFGPL